MGSIYVGAARLDEAGLGPRQQLREHTEVIAASGGEFQRSMHVDADHVLARREPQLALAGEPHVPGFMLLLTD
jgi:hypothetical protein